MENKSTDIKQKIARRHFNGTATVFCNHLYCRAYSIDQKSLKELCNQQLLKAVNDYIL